MNNITLTQAQFETLCAKAGIDSVAVQQSLTAPALETVEKPAEYRVRTDAQKKASHRKIEAVNVRWNMKLAGGTRKVSDLTETERAQYDAEIRACWTKPAGKKVTR